jgi:hypothetical protein
MSGSRELFLLCFLPATREDFTDIAPVSFSPIFQYLQIIPKVNKKVCGVKRYNVGEVKQTRLRIQPI